MLRVTAVLASLGAIGLFLVPPSVAGSQQSRSLPPPLVGTWTRVVTSADIKRAGTAKAEAGEVFPGARFTLAIQKNGGAKLVLLNGERGRWTGPIVAAGATHVHINLPFAFPSTYSWRVGGRQLTLTKISDSEAIGFRPAVFAGVWQRKIAALQSFMP